MKQRKIVTVHYPHEIKFKYTEVSMEDILGKFESDKKDNKTDGSDVRNKQDQPEM